MHKRDLLQDSDHEEEDHNHRCYQEHPRHIATSLLV